MKIFTNNNRAWALAFLAMGAVTFSSCSEDDEVSCVGSPAISDVTTRERVNTLEGGNLADWIIIRGANFCNVDKVLFNDVEADLKEAYITENEITIRIPRIAPKQVTNTITVSSAAGESKRNFAIAIPPISARGLSNEYGLGGDTIAVVGSNFDLYSIEPGKGKVLFGTEEVTILRANSDSVFFKVPANAAVGSTVKLVTEGGTQIAVPGRYKDNRNIIFGYDEGGSVWGAETFITSGPTPAPISGKYLRVNQVVGSWAWTEFSSTNAAIPADVVAHPENYVLKFEVNTQKVFNTNVIKFLIDGDASNVNTYQWVPTVPFNTNGDWRTMSINLSSIINTPLEPSKATHEFKFLFHGNGTLDADISFDNFRIVPKE